MRAIDVMEKHHQPDDKDDELLLFPPCPAEPLPSDCCGLGCTSCVYDMYEKELALWKIDCERIRNSSGSADADDDSSDVVQSPDEYRMLELLSITQMTSDCFRYTFILPKHQILPPTVGQYMVLRWKMANKVVTRQYTPINPAESKDKLDFIIKYKHLVMLAAGTGITPMIQLIQHVLHNDRDDTWLHLVYACKSYSTILCKDLLDQWSDYWNFSVVYVLSKEIEEDYVYHRYGDEVVFGSRLTEPMVRQYILNYTDSVRVLICGTKSFNEDMLSYLRNMDIPGKDIYKF
ncbi:hypothetical protein LSH36_226g01023 [Paralvinella palmiformis]|uniref:cytochrome-b5 reductase n=1 Tax=Paralvinella palmiformis TaxID=53620 RepID=A0AAD9JMY0_9ANNE|nr:hypothetical protein LSH36_226g01023 [Paralvinella palmiformis]